MMNVVFHHDAVAGHLEWFPWQYLSEKTCIVVFGVGVYRSHYLPVPEASHPFLAAVDVLELGFVRGT